MSFNIVLVEPEIPQNTGSIGRLCLATQSTLHLVDPLGFDLSSARLKRAGLDYWEQLRVIRHESLEHFLTFLTPLIKHNLDSTEIESQLIFFTKKSGKTIYEKKLSSGAYLIFGKETFGLPDWVIQKFPNYCARIPILDARVRSLNLSQSAGIAVYEALRQLRYAT